MDRTQLDEVIQLEKTSEEVNDAFFIYRVNAELQLLISQLQYFQSIAAISLAGISILLATGSISQSFWWISAAVVAVVLIIYISTSVREIIDSKANELVETSDHLNQTHQELIDKLREVERTGEINDYKVYLKNLTRRMKSEPVPPSYDGEIVVFLFLINIFLSLVAFINEFIIIQGACALIATLILISISFCLSFISWNRKLSRAVSVFIDKIMKKFVS